MITTRVRSFNDLGLVLAANDALRRMGIEKISLLLPYFPAARQDRVMVAGEPLTVKIYADILNAAQFEQVFILDPHSEVTPALLNNVKVISNHQLVQKALENETDYLLVAPDGGAIKKGNQLSQFLGGRTVIQCGKTRNVATGVLNSFKVFAEDLAGKTCVIVDDICDGGSTFLGLAKELKAKNAGKLILVVTHGIFSKGVQDLSAIFSKIYCSDAFQTINSAKVTQIKIEDLF